MDLGSTIGAAVGGLTGAMGGNNPAPITQTQTFTPWNAAYWGPLQDKAVNLQGNNTLNLPGIPTLPGMPNIASDEAANTYANNVVKGMQTSFSDIGGPLAAIRGDFNAAQPGGGTRQALAEGVAAGREGQAEALARANIMNAIYPVNLNYNAQAAQLANANQQWQYGQGVNAATAQFQAPWTNLLNLSNIIAAASGRGGTTTSTTTLPSTPAWQTGIGGAILGSQLGKGLGGGTTWDPSTLFSSGGGSFASALPTDGLFAGGAGTAGAGEFGGMGLDALIQGFMGSGVAEAAPLLLAA